MSTSSPREGLCRKIVENSGDAIIFSDRQGIIRLWNRGAEHMFGYDTTEAVGQSLDLIIPENLRGRHWDGYYRVMESGESRYSTETLSAPALRKDGTRISAEFSIIMVKEKNGSVLGVAAVIRDVTSRWQRERVLKERLMALETHSQ